MNEIKEHLATQNIEKFQEKKLSKKTISIIIFIAIIFFLFIVRDILIPFFLSGFFAYLLSPMIGVLESRGIKKVVSVIVFYLLFLFFFTGSIIIFLPKILNETTQLNKKIPEYVQLAENTFLKTKNNLEYKYPLIKEQKVFDRITQNIKQYTENFLSKIPSYMSEFFALISILVLIPIITFFFLLEGKNIIGKLIEFLPSRYTETTISIICEIDEIWGNFLRGQFFEAITVGFLSIIGLMILKIDYAIIIGLVAGLSNMIPYLGPVVGSVPAILIALFKFGSFDIVIKVAVMFSIVQLIDNIFIQPIIISKGVNLHPVTVIFALLAGAKIAGVIGMFFAVPIACIIKNTFLILAKKNSLI